MTTLQRLQNPIGFSGLQYDDRIGKVSLIGAGMRSHPGVSARFFGALAEAGVNIEMISTSEIRISVVVDQDDLDTAVTATHRAFELDADLPADHRSAPVGADEVPRVPFGTGRRDHDDPVTARPDACHFLIPGELHPRFDAMPEQDRLRIDLTQIGRRGQHAWTR